MISLLQPSRWWPALSRWRLPWGVAILALASTLLAHLTPAGGYFLRLSYDVLTVLGAERIPDDLLLILVDDSSHKALGQSYLKPFDRSLHAQLLDRLTAGGARLVVYDIVFDQPGEHPESDQAFAEALKRNGRAILSAGLIEFESAGLDPDAAVQRTEVIAPLASFRRAAQGWGMASLALDPDLTVRRIHPGLETIPATAWRALQSVDPKQSEQLTANRLTIEHWLPYSCRPGRLRALSFHEALAPGGLPDGAVRGQIVFIGGKSVLGYSGAERDTFRAPHSLLRTYFADGVAIHALAFDSLRKGRYWTPWGERATLLVLAGVGLAGGFILGSLRPVKAFATAIVMAVATVFIARYLTEAFETIFPWGILPLVSYPVACVASVGFQYYREVRRRHRLKRHFSTYLSPVMVHRMVESGEEPRLGGEDVEITAFFSDIEKFSSFSEVLTSSRLVTLMNEYLGAMTEILQDEQGTLDKYIGDAIVALFNAPLPVPDHALRAGVAAVRMQQRLVGLRQSWAAAGGLWPEKVFHMRMRIGLHTGMATVGNMGSPFRFNYTMMGDNVNLAARCESAAKYYGVYTLATAEMVAAAAAHGPLLLTRPVDRIVVQGRQRPCEIHEILGLRQGAPAAWQRLVEATQTGLDHLWSRRWSEAEAIFAESNALEGSRLELDRPPAVSPSTVLLARARHLAAHPPPMDWNGAHQMEGK